MPEPRNGILARTGAAAMLGLVLLLAAGSSCKKPSSKASPTVKAGTRRPVEIPRQVTGYLGLRNPQSSLDDLLGILREFVPVPFDRNGLLDLLAQRARLPRELLTTIDATASFWLVVLDDRQVGERDPGLLVFPLRSRKSFEAVLEKRMHKAGSDGQLTRYQPRSGEVGLSELRLLIAERHVIVPSSRRVAEICLPFVQQNLLDHPPKYDLALHLLTDHLVSDPRQDLQRRIDRALQRVRTKVPKSSGPNSIDRAPVANAAEEALRYYGDVLKSARELIVTADVDPSQITVAVRAESKPGGLLQKLIHRQHPGPVFGKELLPKSTWLVLSNRSNPEAAAERQKSFTVALRSMFRKLDERQSDRFQAALGELGRRFTGDLSVALHRAPSGTGLTFTVLAEVKGGSPAREAMEQLADVTGDWVKKELRKERDPSLRDMKLTRRPFNKNGAKGSICSLTLHYPEARRHELTRLLGARVGVAWAFKGDMAIFTAGKEAEEQLETIVEALGTGKLSDGSLADTAAFRRAHNASPTRIGLLYISLLDLARWFQGSGMPDAEALAGVLKRTRVASAPSLDWGVNATRTQLDVTLHLPVEHFRIIKPVFDELMKRRAANSLRAPWPRTEREEPP